MIKILAIHLLYKHAVFPNEALKNRRGVYGKTTSDNLSQILKANVQRYMASFPKEIFTKDFHQKIKDIVEKSTGTNDSLKSTQYYSNISSMITGINKLAAQGKNIREDFLNLSAAINDLDSYVDNLISDNIELMALFSPEFRQLMGLSLPENGSIITLQKNMEALKTRMNKDPEEALRKLQKVVADVMGFVHEAEILRGGLRVYKEEQQIKKSVDRAFIQSGAIKKQENENTDQLIAQINDIEHSLYSTITSISSSTPKADLIGSINGVMYGLSLKNAAENKIKAKDKISWSRKHGITLGATGKKLGEIIDEHPVVFGEYDKIYLTQLIYSIHENKDKRDASARFRDILDLASDLTIIDSLVGLQAQNTAGTAQFFIVNNKVFAMEDIVKAIIHSLGLHGRTGVFTANTQLTKVIEAGESELQKNLEGIQDLDEKHAMQIQLGKSQTAIHNIYNVKTKISLQALMSGTGNTKNILAAL